MSSASENGLKVVKASLFLLKKFEEKKKRQKKNFPVLSSLFVSLRACLSSLSLSFGLHSVELHSRISIESGFLFRDVQDLKWRRYGSQKILLYQKCRILTLYNVFSSSLAIGDV